MTHIWTKTPYALCDGTCDGWYEAHVRHPQRRFEVGLDDDGELCGICAAMAKIRFNRIKPRQKSL